MKTIIPFAMPCLMLFTSFVFADDQSATFLKAHCIRCHGRVVQKSDRRFDTLPSEIKSVDDLQRYQDIVDQLNLESMPPEGEPQPTGEERARMVAHLTRQITAAHFELKDSGGHSVLRLLNSWEYRQTIGDLLGLNVEVWNPTESFPAEVKVDGFDNIGAELVTSGMLLDHYFVAAEEAIRRATQFGPRPKLKKLSQQSPFYFTGNSYNIRIMPPSEDFLNYYRDNLENAMRGESETFFRHVLDENLPPREFLRADYSFLNRELALHYGIEGVEGNELRRVSLQYTARGGLLGQGAFLTASANGVDTSPVVRGIYVLEKLLGYTPPPPPPDVPAIEPDIRGAVTIREQLEKHRASASCAECHRKIDPLGFALENFDAIGGWREQYARNLPVNATGQLPNGDRFSTVPGFRKLLVDRQDQFNRCLTEKLMTYALGRELEVGDRPAIDRILASLDRTEGGLRDLIRLIVLSQPFRSN